MSGLAQFLLLGPFFHEGQLVPKKGEQSARISLIGIRERYALRSVKPEILRRREPHGPCFVVVEFDAALEHAPVEERPEGLELRVRTH